MISDSHTKHQKLTHPDQQSFQQCSLHFVFFMKVWYCSCIYLSIRNAINLFLMTATPIIFYFRFFFQDCITTLHVYNINDVLCPCIFTCNPLGVFFLILLFNCATVSDQQTCELKLALQSSAYAKKILFLLFFRKLQKMYSPFNLEFTLLKCQFSG